MLLRSFRIGHERLKTCEDRGRDAESADENLVPLLNALSNGRKDRGADDGTQNDGWNDQQRGSPIEGFRGVLMGSLRNPRTTVPDLHPDVGGVP